MPKKVLVADDEEEIVELLKSSFEMQGYSVVSTLHGSLLLNLVEREKPDLLVLDVMLPGIDGYSLQFQLSQGDATRNIPVIVITALPASRSLFEKFPQVKMFLNKPFDTGELLKKVKEILGE
jgi:DNA-binding response OmpR family regulator